MAIQNPVSGSEAYDLSLFEERSARSLEVVKPTPKVRKEQRKRHRRQSVLNLSVVLLVITAVCAVVAMMIFNRVRITEVNDQILKMQEELGILESEGIRLSGELAAEMSADKVEAYASENGMQKIDSSQMRYITVEEGDRLELADDGEKGFFESVAAGIADIFNWVAYLFE